MAKELLEKFKKNFLHKGVKFYITLAMLVILATAVVSTSVAWMLISRTPIVSELKLSVLTVARLEIAPDVNGSPGEWGVILDLSTVLENLSPLKPVTYSDANNGFYAMNYGLDGRADGVTIALTDEANANVKSDGSASGTDDGYYLMTTFWLRAPATAKIYLSEAKEVEEGTAGAGTFVVGNPVWNGSAIKHENGGNGLETAVRIGLRCQTTDLELKPQGTEIFYIYEPNGDTHYNGSTGYDATYSIDGTGTLVPEERLKWQTTSSWDETAPVLSNQVVYSLGQFQSDTFLFDMNQYTYEKITMYIWLEGNDMDCVNQIAANPTSILANIQFTSNEKEIDTGIDRDNDR